MSLHVQTVKDLRIALKGVNSDVRVVAPNGTKLIEVALTLTPTGQEVQIGQLEPKKDKS